MIEEVEARTDETGISTFEADYIRYKKDLGIMIDILGRDFGLSYLRSLLLQACIDQTCQASVSAVIAELIIA